MRVLVAGFQHETNTFAPSLADWAAFTSGEVFPAFIGGAAMLETLAEVNIPIAGFVREANKHGWTVVPSVWAGATPSSYVTEDAFERIASAILEDLDAAVADGGLDAVYLDLHGAAVAQHVPDCEGELLARVRARVGAKVPVVASLDLHGNVTPRMLEQADALVAYRTYPHVDMAVTGARAAALLARRLQLGRRLATHAVRLPYLISLNAQSTFTEPGRTLYTALPGLDAKHQACVSFCPGFPASDFADCGPVLWAHADSQAQAEAAAYAFQQMAQDPAQWQVALLDPEAAVEQAMELAQHADRPVVIADTQDNSGAGGDSNTTGMLHALLKTGAGKRYPGQVVVGMVFCPDSARAACEAGVGAQLQLSVGKSVPTFAGPSDPPVQGTYTVRAVADGVCRLVGPMMTGLELQLGASACLEIDGVLVAVVSGKAQLLDRAMLRMVGVNSDAMKVVVVKSSVHFRADFQPNASHVLVAKALGPMAADPSELPFTQLNPNTRTKP